MKFPSFCSQFTPDSTQNRTETAIPLFPVQVPNNSYHEGPRSVKKNIKNSLQFQKTDAIVVVLSVSVTDLLQFEQDEKSR